jgi:hypothetical protein
MTVLDNYTKWVAERRFSQGTLQTFQISPNGAGVHYPTPMGGLRWKAYDSQSTTKYRWEPSKPKGEILYFDPNEIRDAITRAHGACWYVSGEADVWAMKSAGIGHVFSGYTESNVPKGLGNFLASWGVNTLLIAPDRDDAGTRWAGKVANQVANSGIEVIAYQLPDELGEKGDLGKAWQRYSQAQPFERYLLGLPRLIPEPLAPPKPSRNPAPNPSAIPQDYKDLIANILCVTGFGGSGFSRKNVHCPFHDDETPSASLHHEKGLYCHTEGHLYLWTEVGKKLGLGSLRDWYRKDEAHPYQLSTEAREILSQRKMTSQARLLDALYAAQAKAGAFYPVKYAAELLKPLDISQSAIYRAITMCNDGSFRFFPSNYDVKKKGEKTGTGGRAGQFYLPSPGEVEKDLGIGAIHQHFDPLPAHAFASNKSYRAEVHASFIRREPGQYTRKRLGNRLGVTGKTTKNYDTLTGIVASPRFRRELLQENEISRLPEKREAIPGNVWLEDENGTKYAPVKKGARKAQKNGAKEIFQVTRLANFYSTEDENEG